MTVAGRGQIYAVALAMGGLCLLPAWDAILSLPAPARSWAPLAWVASATMASCLLAALCLGALSGVPKLLRWTAALILAVLLWETGAYLYVNGKNALAVMLDTRYRLGRNLIITLLLLIVAALVAEAWRGGLNKVSRRLSVVISVLAPLPLVMLLSYGWPTAQQVPVPKGEPVNRMVVVLVFDELDTIMVDADLPNLPNFAALRANALSASQMHPPANYTSESLPAMLSGENFDEASYTRTDVHVHLAGKSGWDSLSRRPTLITDAADSGRRTAVVGWHLPYCSLVRTAQECWDDAAFRAPGTEVDLLTWWLGHSRLYGYWEARRLRSYEQDLRGYSREFLASPQNYRLRRIGGIYAEQSKRLLAAVQERRNDIVFGHLACPHAPSLVAVEVDQLDMYEAYARNLRQCDRLLGEVIAQLQRPGLSQGWGLVVTSDHWFRGRDWLDAGKPLMPPQARRTVPFHVWLSGDQGGGQVVDVLTNSRVLRAMVNAAVSPSFNLTQAKALLQQQGDGPTVLRPF